jgi:hypothetical protein
MKNTKVKLAAIALGFCLVLVSCNKSQSSKEKEVADEKEDLIEAKQDLNEVKQDSINEYNTFKANVELKITENKKRIQDLKTSNNLKGKTERQANLVEIDKLEKRNMDLESKINNYQQGSTQVWSDFKSEVNKEADDLEKSISDVSDRTKKK